VLLERAEVIGGSGSWDWDLETGELLWSDNLFRICGFEPGELSPSPEIVVERTHPHDREALAAVVASMARTGEPGETEYRLVMPDGTVKHVHTVTAVVERDGRRPRRIIGVVQDVTERRLAARELAAHAAVAEALEDWPGLDAGAERLLAALGTAMGMTCGILWVPERRRLACRHVWHVPDPTLELLAAVAAADRVARETSLAGRAWRDGGPLTTRIGKDEPAPDHEREAFAAGLRGALAIPLVAGRETLAVIELHSVEELEPTERLLRSMTGIGHELGYFFDRRRGELGPPVLTPRELEVLQLAARGHTGPAIARELHLSPATIKRHFEGIYARLGVSDRAAAVAIALRRGLIS
jgi:PAS domain S-box-containing protein